MTVKMIVMTMERAYTVDEVWAPRLRVASIMRISENPSFPLIISSVLETKHLIPTFLLAKL